MESEVDRRHGTYQPSDVVPLDMAPSETEYSPSGTIVARCIPKATDHPERELEITGCDVKPNILSDALACTQGDRQAAYGSPAMNWGRTAKIAQAITGLDCLTPEVCVKVAMAMKQARLIQTPNHRDSMVDLAGYSWVLSEVVE